MGRWLGLCWVLAGLGAGVGPAGVAGDLARGIRFLRAGRLAAGSAEIQRAVEQDRGVATSRSAQGAVLLLQGETSRAADEFRQAAALDDATVSAHQGLIACHMAANDLEAALAQAKRALSHEASDKLSLRASYAYLCCLVGLYDATLTEGTRVLSARPDDRLAREAVAAAFFARGDYAAAGRTLDEAREPLRLAGPLAPCALDAPSPLFAENAAYRLAHRSDDREQLAWLPALSAGSPGPSAMGASLASAAAMSLEPEWETAPVRPAPAADASRSGSPREPTASRVGVTITSPKDGSALIGPTAVSIDLDHREDVGYVVLLADGVFQSLSNSYPHRLSLDTRRLTGGLHDVRVDAYTTQGQLVGSARISVRVGSEVRNRTVSPDEADLLSQAEEELEGLLALRAHPLGEAQLRGRVQEALGLYPEAMRTYEGVFSAQPGWPGAKRDLLWAYKQTGLLDLGSRPREIRTLGASYSAALTFDDGPHPIVTPYLLDLLDKYHARGTFLLVGQQVELYPSLAQEIVRRGHEVGCHSYSHRDLRGLSQDEVEWELVKTRAVIREATGCTVRLFRPPGGHYNHTVYEATVETGFQTVFWDSNIGYFAKVPATTAAEKMRRELTPSGIALLHNGEDATVRVLPDLLRLLTAAGMRMDTVTALLQNGR